MEKLIQRCLQKDPDRRFQHMGDVKVELREIKEESESSPVASAVPARRSRLRWLAAGLVGALVLIVGGWLLWRPQGAEIPLPLVVSLTSTPGREREPTFSPDGNQVAFSWEGEKQDNSDIYIKMIRSAETRRLTTNPAIDRFPSWSPDGRQIAFIRTSREDDDGTIHLVSPLGGSDHKLSDQAAFGRLSWSPEGRWLATGAGSFTHDPRSGIRGIRLIGVPGGEARSITSPSERTHHSDPAFSPDGHHLAYATCLTQWACQIDVVELGTEYAPMGTAQRLTRKPICPVGLAWTRDGKSVIYSDCRNLRLWRVGIAGDQPPMRIEVAGYNPVWPAIAISRDRLAFERLLNRHHIYRFEVGRPSEAAVATSSLGDWHPHFSPDGRRFAFGSGRAGGGEGDAIWLAAADGSNPTQLTHGPGTWQGSPRWSPDGQRIAFDAYDEDEHSDIWTIDADGGSLRRLTSDPGDETHPSWSRDGRFVYFSAPDREGGPGVWRIPASGGKEERLTHNGGGRTDESADGKTLFFQGKTDFGNSPLLALPLAGGPEREIIDCVVASNFSVGPAGIYHLGCVANQRAVPLYLLDLATGRDRLLGKVEWPLGGLTVSPDGKTILYMKLGGEGSDLMMIEDFR